MRILLANQCDTLKYVSRFVLFVSHLSRTMSTALLYPVHPCWRSGAPAAPCFIARCARAGHLAPPRNPLSAFRVTTILSLENYMYSCFIRALLATSWF